MPNAIPTKTKTTQSTLSLKLICLAEITSPHGIRGAVKIRSFTQDPSSIFDYPELIDQKGKIYKIKFFAAKQNSVFVVTIEGITTCNQAEALRSTKLYVNRDLLPAAKDDEFYYEDLVGLDVITTDGEMFGTVNRVVNHILEINSLDNHILSLPFLKESVPTIDLNDRKITIVKDYLIG